MLGLACISCSPKSHCANASTRPGRVAPVWAASLLAARKTSTLLPTTEPGLVPGLAPGPPPAPNHTAEAGEGAGIRRRPRGPLPLAPHILCFPPAPAQEALSASHREGAAREPGEAISVQSGQAAGAGGAWRWRQRRRPSVCFYFTQQKVLFVEANRRWGLELGGGRKRKKKKKATSTTTHRSSPELSRGGE